MLPTVRSATNSRADLSGRFSAPDEVRGGIARDALVVLVLAGACVAFYALFKAVALLAGLPFP